ncbi:hypothetical protein [Cohnella sp. AR92]|uniref:hypothetical protein n=1 Tax=Cohnella sp. AR92 TaxID=648716 RepID=UPI000F8E9375|nr:hypothetical protein [Cohnella sp. AR92]RUS44929.1 hypothetical protein ELR57_21985 [Cohnella sp. AR92]
MNYRDYKQIKQGQYQSVGMLGEFFVYEVLTGIADVPEYYQITKNEFETFEQWQNNDSFIVGKIKNRKCICSGYRGHADSKMEDLLSDEELLKA